MSMAMYDTIHRYVIDAVCEQPMHVGSADGEREDILRHPTTGRPFIQASGIAGVLADYVQKAYGEDARISLFGGVKLIEKIVNGKKEIEKMEIKSRVAVLDGHFDPAAIKLEMRTRCSLNGETGTVNRKKGTGNDIDSGQLVTAEYIGTGSEFSFVVLVYGDGYQKVEESLSAIDAGKIRFGGQNTTGFGRVSLKSVRVSSYNMKNEQDRERWAGMIDMYKKDGNAETDTVKKLASTLPDKEYRITFEAALDTALLIKANMVDEERITKSLGNVEQMPDFMNITNAQKEYIIPGTSLKGVFRSRIEMIGGYLGLPWEWIEEVFEQRSKILFEDAVIREDISYEKKRIHLNKISGSTKYKALFSECVTGGKTEIAVHIDTARLEKLAESKLTPKACIALLLYVIRDLAVGTVALGSGTSIGRGLVGVDRVQIWESGVKKEDFPGRPEEKSPDIKGEQENIVERADFSLAENQDVKNDFVEECLKELEKLVSTKDAQEA